MAAQASVKPAALPFVDRVIGAMTLGAAGAVVGAALSSVTEPIVNRILVKRMTLPQAIEDVGGVAKFLEFFNTTVSTNLIKFPLFEVVNMALADVDLPASGRGAILGAIFTTVTLPITNYRYQMSIKKPGYKPNLAFSSLYQAYLPTVMRDIVYGIVRNYVSGELSQNYPDLGKTASGRFTAMFVTVACATLTSAPGNEVRGYYLQAPESRQSVSEFFQPVKFIRSTTLGVLIMSTALGVATLATGPAQEYFQQFREYLNANPLGKLLLALFLAHQFMETRRQQEIIERLETKKPEEKTM